MDSYEVFKSFPVIETDRLLLREILPNDEEDLFDMFSDEETMKYYGLDTYKSLDDAADTIKHMRKGFKNRWLIKWAVSFKDSGRFIGLCGFHNWVKSDRRSEIGYILSKDLWGKGITGEAVKAIIRFGFSSMGLNRIEAVVRLENSRSISLLHRCGFKEEGLLKQYKYYNGQFSDFLMLALLMDEYNRINKEAGTAVKQWPASTVAEDFDKHIHSLVE